jgi:hypothetical protein
MIQVEYSFCRMRLSATGFTLPWQLVAAHDPGPRYFADSACPARTIKGHPQHASNARQKITPGHKLSGLRIVSLPGISQRRITLFAYIVSRSGSSTSRIAFFAACREKPKGSIYTSLSCQ